MPPAVHHSTIKGNNNQEITETKSTYITIKSTLQSDDIGVVPGLFSFLQALQRSCMWSRKLEWETAWERG